MKKFLYVFMVALTVVTSLTSCDEHEPIDMSIKIGDVLCDDHRIMSLSEYKNQSSVKAVGVVFGTSTDNTSYYAVTLDELGDYSFSSIIGYEQGTSCDVTAYDGYTNTTSLQNTTDSIKNDDGSTYYLYSPMAEAVFRAGKFGQSIYIPSVTELRLLVANLSTVNPVIEALGGTPISVSSDAGHCWYWSSTEVQGNPTNQAWLVSIASGGSYQEAPKDEIHPVRTIISVYQ